MHKVYLLLRNNKQSGPYNLDELQQLELQAKDLVWIEGKSTGWQYPSEIPELHSQEDLALLSTGKNQDEQDHADKNQFTKKIYVRLPSTFNPGTTVAKKDEAKNLGGNDLDERKLAFEKKAEELHRRMQSFTSSGVIENDEAGTEIRYCRSLQDLKQEYVSWIHKQNHKTFQWRKMIWIPALVLSGGIAVFGILHLLKNKETPTAIPFNTTGSTGITNETKESLDRSIVYSKQQLSNPAKPASNKNRSEKRSIANGIKNTSPKTKTKTSPYKPSIAARDPSTKVASQNKKPGTFIPQLVKVQGKYKPIGKGVASPEITVKNNSSEPLKLVAVNVNYYKTNGKLAGKETLYFNDLAAGESLTLKAPAHMKAEEVRFQLGLISTGDGGIYYARN